MTDIFALQKWLRDGTVAAFSSMQGEGLDAAPWLFLTALGFGLVHALLPGHGKLLLAAHYAGRADWRAALLSSVLVIVAHVGSAIAIVLSGFAILQRTLGQAGRAIVIERLSAGLIVAIGVFLLWRSVRPAAQAHRASGQALALAAGLVPCPLTAFAMTFAMMKGAVGAGLLLSAGFALGMIVTVALFPLTAMAAHGRFVSIIEGRRAQRVTRSLTILGALAIIAIGFGSWP